MFKGLIKKAKQKLHLHTSGQLQECREGNHVSPHTHNICASCKKQTCENCQIEAPNVRIYCMKCYTTKPELSQIQAIPEEDADDMFDFGSGVGGFTKDQSAFEKVSVKYDRDTGEFVGISQFLDFAQGNGGFGAKPEESKGAAASTGDSAS